MAKILKASWDFSPLFKSDNDHNIEKERKTAVKKSYEFIKKWKNNSEYLSKPDTLKIALDEYNEWLTSWGTNAKENYYFDLRFALNQNDAAIKGKVNKSEELSNKILNDIQFFELNLAKISPGTQTMFLNYKPLSSYKHFLKRLFTQSKYILSDAEEKILNLKTIPAHANWVRMVSGLLSKEEKLVLNKESKKELKNFEEIVGLMENTNKKVRDTAAKAFNSILEKHTDVVENEFNSVLLNKKINDELRGYDRPDKSRHLNDDVESEVVDLLVSTVTDNFDIAKDYYKLKARLFGVEKLEYHERNVEYGKLDKKYTFKKGSNIISKVFSDLDLEFKSIFETFLVNGNIDVFPKKGKRGGAFCAYGLKTLPVYVLLNWSDMLSDVRTLAHEMGHAINDELVRNKQNALNFGTPTSTAEVASTFMEDFVIQELMQKENDELKLSLMMSKLNQDVSSIFRQVAFYNFESEIHLKFREMGYLSKEEIGKIFQKHMATYMGPAIEQSEGSQNWWTYVSHFRSFFYVYSYAMGLLISKSLQSKVKNDHKFVKKVKVFLSTGLSMSPKGIFNELGVDITDKAFWEEGLKEIKSLLKETEELAIKLHKI